jgi:hypothetical protein
MMKLLKQPTHMTSNMQNRSIKITCNSFSITCNLKQHRHLLDGEIWSFLKNHTIFTSELGSWPLDS